MNSGPELQVTPGGIVEDVFLQPFKTGEAQRVVNQTPLEDVGTGGAGLYEVDIIRKDGSAVPVELTGGYSSYQGQPTNVVYLRDVSERKQAEENDSEERNKYLHYSNMRR